MFPPNTKILIVDDMKTIRKLVQQFRKDLGYNDVTEADDGETAWPMIEFGITTNTPFQLIISDWNMPKMPGIALLKKVRANDKLKSVPFIFVTAEAEKNQIMEALQSGVSNYIIKPFTPATIKEKLQLAWAKHNPGK